MLRVDIDPCFWRFVGISTKNTFRKLVQTVASGHVERVYRCTEAAPPPRVQAAQMLLIVKAQEDATPFPFCAFHL